MDGFEPLWVVGLVLLHLDLGGRLLGATGERYEWSQYMLLGTALPACVLALTLARSLNAAAGAALRVIRLGLAAYGVAAGVALVARHGSAPVLAVAVLNWAILTAASWARRGLRPAEVEGDGEPGGGVAGSAAALFVLAVSWSACARVCFWTPFETWVGGSAVSALALLAALVLVSADLLRRDRPPASGGRRFPRLYEADALAAVLAALMSLRLDSLGRAVAPGVLQGFGVFTLFHWGPIVGPAELIRQGGWPLWDVPCQYGLLNTLVLAWMPFQSVWQSLYVVNAVVTGVSAWLLYAILRTLRPGRVHAWISLGLTLASVYLVAGEARSSTGSWIGPCLGAYRFLWCYVLLGLLVLGFRTGTDGTPGRRTLAAGCLAWLVGTFWSCESAVYCAAAWLPAYAYVVLRAAAAPGPLAARVGAAALRLAVPPVLFGSVVAAVSAYYVARLGHGPDWRTCFDFSAANFHRGGVPLDPSGAVWFLLLVFCALTIVVARQLDRRRPAGAVGLATGAWGAVWATSSYFVVRSEPSLVINLSPVVCAAVASALHLDRKAEAGDRRRTPARLALIPVLAVILALPFGNPRFLADWARAARRGYVRSVDRMLPRMDPDLKGLLDRAGVRDDDPVCYVDRACTGFGPPIPFLNAMPVRAAGADARWVNRAWLPTLPFSLFLPLTEDQGLIYFRRFTERSRLSGWLIEPKAGGLTATLLWFHAAVSRTHNPTTTFESDLWKLTWYERKGEAPPARSPGVPES